MTPFKETKEAIQFANEHLVSGGFFNNIILTATPISDTATIQSNTPYNNKQVDILEHVYQWSLSPINKERTRLFYLFGDFGAGKSGVCKALVNKIYQKYEDSRYGDTMAQPTLPLYFDLRILTGIYGEFELASKTLAELLEVMFYATGITKINDLEGKKGVDGDDIIKLVRQYPCIVVFDGFDYAVQKLGKNQQNGLLNKLLSIFPKVQYTKDLMRIIGQPVEESTIPDSPSRVLISCRSQLFESGQEQNAFTEAFYNTELSINGIHNYQAYRLDGLPTDTVKKSIQRTIYSSNKDLPVFEQLDLNHEDSKLFVDYLVDLSINPLLLAMSKSLLPSIKPSLNKTGFINSAELFTDLITKMMHRDSGKSIINIKEKQKILGAVALKIWQERIGFISLESLRQFFFEYYSDYRQIQLGVDTGRVELETAFQDLHSSMITRDDNDMYYFCHPLIFNYFLAVGVFEVVMHAKESDSTHCILDSIVNIDSIVNKSSTKDKIDLITMLSIDSLIFISHMVMSLVVRRDMNSYNHFYQQWLTVCEQVASFNIDNDNDNNNANSDDDDARENSTLAEDKGEEKAIEMWEVVIGEDIPESLAHLLKKSSH